jgi:hypothetical protein
MIAQATGTFDTKDWEETTVSEIPGGGKLTHVHCVDTFYGDIEGTATTEYVLVYRSDGSDSYVGLEHATGQIAGQSGSFVLRHSGTFDDGGVKGLWVVVPGAGTGNLRSLSGEGSNAWDGKAAVYTLDYELD